MLLDGFNLTTEADLGILQEDDIQLPHRFVPRNYQKELFNTFFDMLEGKNFIRNYSLVQHRRSGKDVGLFQLVVAAAAMRVGSYGYFLPLANQARRVILQGIVHDSYGVPCQFRDFIPDSLYLKFNTVDSYFELSNGSKIYVLGSDHYDALVGTNLVGAVFSEWALADPNAYQFIKPMLNATDGWVCFCTTPRGMNHAYTTYLTSIKEGNKDRWFSTYLTINDTRKEDGSPIITQAQIDQDIADGMDEDIIKQEYFLDWTAQVKGTIYAKELGIVRDEDRIRAVPIDKSQPFFSFWDLGVSDHTAIWLMQVDAVTNQLNMIGYYENTDEGMGHYLGWLRNFSKKYDVKIGKVFLPHDGKIREFTSGKKRHEAMIEEGFDVTVLPRISDVELGIRQTKAIFGRMVFDENRCVIGLAHLDRYRRRYNKTIGTFGGPLHDEASNAADALRQMGQYYELPEQTELHHKNSMNMVKNTFINNGAYDIGSLNGIDSNLGSKSYDPMMIMQDS